MFNGPCAKASVRLAVVTLMAAALSGGWELVAQQSPGSPLYIGMLPGPISALRELATGIGLSLVAVALLMPWASGRREPWGIVALLYVGTLLGVGAQVYGALRGMNGVQLMDLRADARPLFLVKIGGLSLLTLGCAEIGRRVLFRPPPT
jgi:hypothetical protein